MAQTQISCPNCKSPIMADVQQLFDVAQDPSSKTKLLSGISNVVQCPVCGYQGALATPIVYHDPEKELLLTFVPPEIGLPHDEQERLLGSLINQVVNNLALEKRKAYLFTPQAHLTMQGLVERVLEADGITKEMIQAQQEKLEFLQRLARTTDQEERTKIVQDKGNLVDADLFNILTRLLQTAASTGDEESVSQLEEIQSLLLEDTEFGKQVKQQTDEVRAAVESLQSAGQDLTREKLVDLVIEAPNEIRISALVSLARPGMDYQFFQILSQRIDASSGEERERLSNLREQILTLTEQIDKQAKQRSAAAQQLVNQILEEGDLSQAIQQHAPEIDEFFLQAIQQSLDEARKSGDLERSANLSQLEEIIRQATAQPPEIEFLEELLEAENEAARQDLIENNKDKITPEFFQMLSGLMNQVMETSQDPELVEQVKAVNRQVLRFSMQSSLQGE